MGLKSLAKKVKIENNTAPIAEVFTKALDSYLVDSGNEEKLKREENKRLAFNPSSYFKCKREVYYMLTEAPARVDKLHGLGQRWLHVGTSLHEWVQNEVLAKMSEVGGYQLDLIPPKELAAMCGGDIEVIEEHGSSPIEIKYLDRRFTKEIPISAMVDGAFNFKGIDMLFEFKTINPTKFETLIQPLKEHRAQGGLYALTFNLPVMFLYLCKGTQKWSAFLINYSEEQLEAVKERLQTLEEHVLNKKVPTAKKSDDVCKYCLYKKQCRKDGDLIK